MGCSVGAVAFPCTPSLNMGERGLNSYSSYFSLEIFYGAIIHIPKPSYPVLQSTFSCCISQDFFSPLGICTAKYLLVTLSSPFSIWAAPRVLNPDAYYLAP